MCHANPELGAGRSCRPACTWLGLATVRGTSGVAARARASATAGSGRLALELMRAFSVPIVVQEEGRDNALAQGVLHLWGICMPVGISCGPPWPVRTEWCSLPDASTMTAASLREIAETEAVVIGAGSVGTSIAYALANRGADVILLDRAASVCAETSAANAGLIWVQTKVPAYYTRFSLLSSNLYPDLVRALDDDVEYDRPGGLRLALTEPDWEEAIHLAEQQRQVAGLSIEILDGDAVRRLEPAVGPDVVGGIHCRQDGHINPILYVHALARGARRKGARIVLRTAVTGIVRRPDGAVAGVVTPEGVIRTRAVVNAAGVLAPVVAAMVGFRLPIIPCRGQVVVTEALPPTLTRPLANMQQTARSGVFLCGETGDFAGLDKSTDLASMRSVARRAIRLIPTLARSQVLRVFAGLRPWPPDGVPFLGPVSTIPGFYVAVGHSGITLSPLYGKVLSELIVDGRTDVPIEPYDPCRFDGRDEVVFIREHYRRDVSLKDPSWPTALLSA